MAQGVAGAVVVPQVLSILGVTYTGPDHVRALSAYGVALGLAAVGGQVIGGALVQTDVLGLGWRGCFLINVPIGLAALALTPRLVPESRAPRRTGLDATGAALLALGLVAVLLPLIEGRQHGWQAWTWISLGLAPLVLAGFVAHQARARLMLASTQASFFVYLALYLQQGRGLNPLQAGVVFTILAAAYVVVSGPAPDLVLPRHDRVELVETPA